MIPRSLRELSHRRRFALARQIQGQNVAEHSFFVAVYADLIADIIGWGGDRATLLRYALWHDAGEVATGDIPGPVKRQIVHQHNADQFQLASDQEMYGDLYQNTVAPSEQARRIVKVANLMDETFYLQGEWLMGNRHIAQFLENSKSRLEKAVGLIDWVSERVLIDLVSEIGAAIFRHQAADGFFVSGVDTDVAPKPAS